MSTLVELKHGYDQASNRLYRRDEVARGLSASFDELYAYDGLHRLTSFDRGQLNSTNNGLSSGPTISQDWTLDPLGNWNRFQQGVVGTLDQARTHNAVNEIDWITETVGALWPTPAYDANGNTTNFSQPGALTEGYTAKYDAWNQLVKLTNDSDDDKTVAEFAYDGLNRRTIKKVFGDGALDYTRHYYFSDQWQVLEERVDSAMSADRQYVWGMRYVDDLVLRDHDSTRLYALTDALFNVVALTDNTGDVKERFAYQPYGQSEELDPDFASYSGTDYEWEYRFTGRELDLESGLQLNRNRYLHLQMGRWVTRDPKGYQNGLNLFQDVGSSPPNHLDPTGTICITCGWQRPTDPGPVVHIKICVQLDVKKCESRHLLTTDCGWQDLCVGTAIPKLTLDLSQTKHSDPYDFAAVAAVYFTACGQSRLVTRPVAGRPEKVWSDIECKGIDCMYDTAGGYAWITERRPWFNTGQPDPKLAQSGIAFRWDVATLNHCGEYVVNMSTPELIGPHASDHTLTCNPPTGVIHSG